MLIVIRMMMMIMMYSPGRGRGTASAGWDRRMAGSASGRAKQSEATARTPN